MHTGVRLQPFFLMYLFRARKTTNLFHVKAFFTLHFPAMRLQLLVLDKCWISTPHLPPSNKLQDSFALQIQFLVFGNILVQTNSCKVRAYMHDKSLCAGSSCFFILSVLREQKFSMCPHQQMKINILTLPRPWFKGVKHIAFPSTHSISSIWQILIHNSVLSEPYIHT